jgi:hypothetical protein
MIAMVDFVKIGFRKIRVSGLSVAFAECHDSKKELRIGIRRRLSI